MKQDQQKIDIENARLAKKLNQMPSTLDHKQLRLDFEKNMKYKSLRAHPKAHTAKKAPPLKLPYLESKRAFSNSTAKSSSHSDMKATDKMSINLSQPPEEVEQHLEETQTEFYPETSFSANTKSQTKYNSPPVVMTTQPLLEQRLPEKIDHEVS